MQQPIIFISPYQKLTRLALKLTEHRQDLIKVVTGDLEEGVQLAKREINKGSVIVISRGGTAHLIQENTNCYLIDLTFTPIGFLHAIREIMTYKVVVMGYSNFTEIAKKTYHLFNKSVDYIKLHDDVNVVAIIKYLRQHKIEYVIGDYSSILIAREADIPFTLIETGEDSILQALAQAESLYQNIHKRQMYSSTLVKIFDVINKDFILLDNQLNILQFNNKSGCGISLASQLTDEMLTQVVSKKEYLGELYETNHTMFSYNIHPIYNLDEWDGAIIILTRYDNIISINSNIKSNLGKTGFVAKYTLNHIIHQSSKIKECISLAKIYAHSLSTILICGESGTGKELFAQGIHNESAQKSGSFVAINCASIPASLIESELFGYSEGAFTGAVKGGKPGVFEKAEGGSLFLDEIDSLSLAAQANLLRVLQEKEIIRIGDKKVIPINVRVICASNVNLTKKIQQELFRMDLFFRISTFQIYIPALRERKEDIFYLFLHITGIKKENIEPEHLKSIEHKLLEYQWPGNVRELLNVCERYKMTNQIIINQLQLEIKNAINLYQPLNCIENDIIQTLYQSEQSINRVSDILKIDRSTVRRKLNETQEHYD